MNFKKIGLNVALFSLGGLICIRAMANITLEVF